MKKIKLSVESLEVTSFDVSPRPAAGSGTVEGHVEAELQTETECPSACGTLCSSCFPSNCFTDGCDSCYTFCYSCDTNCGTCPPC